MPEHRPDATAQLTELLRERIVVLDGAWGTLIQGHRLEEADFRGEQFAGHSHELKGNTDVLCLTRPDIVAAIHRDYLDVGADLTTTNTFTATRIAQADYGLEEHCYALNRSAAAVAREVCDEVTALTPDRPRFVVGALGPTTGPPRSAPRSTTRAPATWASTSWSRPTSSRRAVWSTAVRTC